MDNGEFEILRFLINSPSESKNDRSGHTECSGADLTYKYFITKSSVKSFSDCEINLFVELEWRLFDEGFESYNLFLNAPDLKETGLTLVKLSGTVLIECLADGKLVGAKKFYGVLSRSPNSSFGVFNINFDPGCQKHKVTIIFEEMDTTRKWFDWFRSRCSWSKSSSKEVRTVKEVRTEIDWQSLLESQ